MSSPLLTTKLFLPPCRSGAVPRRHLIERLNREFHGRVILVSAPAGFGKTSLVATWAVQCGQPVSWLSLDEADNDPGRFLTYVVAALGTVYSHIGQGALDMLHDTPPVSPLSVMTALLNDLAMVPEDMVLVLDDCHQIETGVVDDLLALLVEHVPPGLSLVLVTREDPSLPLSRLRANGRMTEIRVADLRFSHAEAAQFFRQTMNLDLGEQEIKALESRTEGWVAGLQLAAISMRGQEDIPGFIRSFAGSHHFVLDYLMDEVLQRQPQAIRNFLLRTSILERLSASLCDTLLPDNAEGGGDGLDYLMQANLFLIPLDDQHQWYRYHHLFADVLRARLQKEYPGLASELHQLASIWFKSNNLVAEAIHHALAAQAFALAADLIECAWMSSICTMSVQRSTGNWKWYPTFSIVA